MCRDEVRVTAERLLAEARAVRAAFPDAGNSQPVPPPRGGAVPSGGGLAALQAAFGYLRDEVAVVRAGRTQSPVVLDDEVANAERLLEELEAES